MRTLLMVMLVSLLGACAHHVTSVRSSWYVVQEAKAPVTYIAIVNQGNRTIDATEVILNPLRDRLFSSSFHSAWHLAFARPESIAPGKTLVLRADRFFQGTTRFGPCMAPVEINLRIVGRDSLLLSQLDAGLPNSLPLGWEIDCNRKEDTPAR